MSKFTTVYGKDVATFVAPNSSHYKIKFIPGGELPECLSGIFTSERLADQAIVKYMEEDKPRPGRPPKEKGV